MRLIRSNHHASMVINKWIPFILLVSAAIFLAFIPYRTQPPLFIDLNDCYAWRWTFLGKREKMPSPTRSLLLTPARCHHSSHSETASISSSHSETASISSSHSETASISSSETGSHSSSKTASIASCETASISSSPYILIANSGSANSHSAGTNAYSVNTDSDSRCIKWIVRSV